MTPELYWAVAGFLLVISELLTGTFYLLVIGVGAFAGALVAWLGFPVATQAASAAMLAFIGTAFVHTLRVRPGRQATNSIDTGQSVTVESWIDKKEGRARVRYRDTLWDAQVQNDPGDPGAPGEASHFYILGTSGSTLLIGAKRP